MTAVYALTVHYTPSWPHEGGWVLRGIFSSQALARAHVDAMPRGREGDIDRWRIEALVVDQPRTA